MFPALQLEIIDRFTAVERYFERCCRLEREFSQTARGLAFVQIYAIHEYAVKTVVEAAARAIEAQAHAYEDLRPSLLALFLAPQLQSARDASQANLWDRRLALFEKATSKEPAVLVGMPETPTDGSHYRHQQILLILKIFGIKKNPTVRRRHLYTIDEVVNKRNAIAHGNETAAEVGRGSTNDEVRKKIQQMKSACLRLIKIVEEYCGDPDKHCR